MKKYKYILLLFAFMLFFSGSCENNRGNQNFITIQNNSDKEIVFLSAIYFSIAQSPFCIDFTRMIRREYHSFIRNFTIEPRSSKKTPIDLTIEAMQNHPDVVEWISIGIFYRQDIETMSCEEFKQAFPIRQEWRVTLADLEAVDFNLTLVYNPAGTTALPCSSY